MDGCRGRLDCARGRDTVINQEEGGLSESILIVSVRPRIYIVVFCARDLSESILIVVVF